MFCMCLIFDNCGIFKRTFCCLLSCSPDTRVMPFHHARYMCRWKRTRHLRGRGRCRLGGVAHLRAPRSFYHLRDRACFGVSISIVQPLMYWWLAIQPANAGCIWCIEHGKTHKTESKADLGGQTCQCTALGGFRKAGFVLQWIILGWKWVWIYYWNNSKTIAITQPELYTRRPWNANPAIPKPPNINPRGLLVSNPACGVETSKIALLLGHAHDFLECTEASDECPGDMLSVSLATVVCVPILGLRRERTLDEHSGSKWGE
jgi:hypothetical protein